MKAARKVRRLQQPQSLMGYVREFLAPQVWKQARQANSKRRANPRWDLQPLVLVLLAMTWAAGDSQAERFEAARGFYVMAHEARKRPGKTLEGFQKALSRLPLRPLRALAEGVRQQILRLYGERLRVDGFIPMGCDGSRAECGRIAELEARLGKAGKDHSAPSLWITAFVHLGLGLLWSWRLGKGDADERLHLRQLLDTLPRQCLIVADAAYMGYELALNILRKQHSFLLRMSSKMYLYTLEQASLDEWEEGPVLYWPERAQGTSEPLFCRLIRIKARDTAKHDVWLLTNVLDPQQLSAATAAKFYRWRWKNEGLFRTYKRTLKKLKLCSRTVRLVHREAEVSLLALQLLLAHADLALRQPGTEGREAVSPRKVLLAIRTEMNGSRRRRGDSYARQLKKCSAERRQQKSPKAIREWPRRKPHKPPGPPVIRTLTDRQKALLEKYLHAI
jgi:hypothetical protein